jgi:L-lactate dehydrogenase complex protein LldG
MEGAPQVTDSRAAILARIRGALGRKPGQAPPPLPPTTLRTRNLSSLERVELFVRQFEKLNGKPVRVRSRAEAAAAVRDLMNGHTAVASNAPFLSECGIPHLAGVQSGFTSREELRAACATADFGITSADYALADTGTFVMIASPHEARLISLLPPVHIAVTPASRFLPNLDELFARVPLPADQASSMVLITGPSRTADIEQILVRGVHGPGELYAVIVEEGEQ